MTKNKLYFLIFLFLLSSSSFALVKKEIKILDEKAQEENFKKDKIGVYLGLNLGPSYHMTSLDQTTDNNFLHLGFHPFTYEFFVGYKIWRFRVETSFLHRATKTFMSRYEVEHKESGLRFLDYEATMSSHAFALKFYYDIFKFTNYVNPFILLGLSLATTNLKTWIETDVSSGRAALEVDGKSTTSKAVLGGLGNSFVISDEISVQVLSQLTFLQSMATEDESNIELPEDLEWSQSRPLPREGLHIIVDFLVGLKYEI